MRQEEEVGRNQFELRLKMHQYKFWGNYQVFVELLIFDPSHLYSRLNVCAAMHTLAYRWNSITCINDTIFNIATVAHQSHRRENTNSSTVSHSHWHIRWHRETRAVCTNGAGGGGADDYDDEHTLPPRLLAPPNKAIVRAFSTNCPS